MKLKLSNIFAILHFVLFLGIFLLFFYWQFKSIKEFHDIELNNFFEQTDNIVKILLDKQHDELKEIVHININNFSNHFDEIDDIGNLDFIFLTKNKEIKKISGFSLVVDIQKLAERLKAVSNIQNKIVTVELDSKKYFLLAYKEKIVSEKLGKVDGEIWGVIVLNENHLILESIRDDIKIKELLLLDNSRNIISSTIKKENIISNINLDTKNLTINESLDDKLLYRKNNFTNNIDVLYMIDNHHYNNIYQKFIYKVWWVILIFILIGIVIYLAVRYMFIEKMVQLKLYIKGSFQGKNSSYTHSNIRELDEIFLVFEDLFTKFKRNKTFQEVLIQTIPIPFFSKDKDFKYNEVNDAFLQMIGKKRIDILNKTVSEVASKNLSEIYSKADFELKEDKEQVFEAKVQFSDGKQHDVMFFKTCLYNENNSFDGLVGVVLDITKTKNIEQQLKEQVDIKTKELISINESLEKRVSTEVEKNRKKDTQLFENAKNAQMGEMIGNIAHQWRQPLSVISTVVSGMDLARKFGKLSDKEFQDRVQTVMRNVKYLSSTIDTFREYIKEKNEVKVVTLQDRIDSSLSIVEASLKNSYIDIIKEIDYEKPIYYKMAVGELSQVIINILNNAKDILITKEKIAEKWVKIGLYKSSDKVIIYIEDNGGGVPENIIDKIFNPYFTTKHQSQGTGLGLHMSKDIIEKHFDGKLYIENMQNGAKFIIELPVQE